MVEVSVITRTQHISKVKRDLYKIVVKGEDNTINKWMTANEHLK